MKGNTNWLQQLMDGMDLPGENLPKEPLIEIAGDRRVLVENHSGVTEYGREKIQIRVRYGQLCVCGGDLEMIRMTRQQLIITGRIDAVNLIRRRS